MASPTISYYDTNPLFIGNPIVLQVTPTGSGVNASFYRLKVKLVAELADNGNVEFGFSVPIETKMVNNVLTAQNARFDISSALRAVAEAWQPTATPPVSYPSVDYYVEVTEEWMIDGTPYNSDTARSPASYTASKFMGALTDRERIVGSTAWPTRYSRKPTSSPEICFLNHYVIVPDDMGQNNPSVTLYLADSLGNFDFGNLNYYVMAPPPNGHEIRFINSLGVHENIFVYGLPQKNTHIDTEQYVIDRQETLSQFSRGLAIKSNDYETWALTSGPIDKQWASWYIHEFLMARWLWININGTFIPCHVIPEETTPLTDDIAPARPEVQFKIRLDINGSPL